MPHQQGYNARRPAVDQLAAVRCVGHPEERSAFLR